MKLKAGIIIIGSLLWDNSKKRKFWRKNYLNKRKINVSLPIRYGRISSSRMDTYTMTYCPKLNKKDYGQGIILEFKDPITSLDHLKEISENTIRVERDKTKEEWKVIKSGEPFTLNWNWGVLGICINPKHKQEDVFSKDISEILELWKNSLVNFNPNKFSLNGEPLMINKDGVFVIDWTESINKFDFLISVIVEPNTETEDGKYPDANRIAKKMYEGNYYSYFINNIENSIHTNVDEEIKRLIKSQYCVSNYIMKLEGKKART